MKTFIKVISSIIFVPLSFILIIAGSLKYQILNTQFWIEVFEKHNVYRQIQFEINDYLDEKNANVFKDITTRENIKDFLDKNTGLVIKFFNGKMDDLTFYIPVSRIPRELLPKKMGTLEESMTAKELIQRFNIGGIDPRTFDQFRNSGMVINYVFFTALIFFVAVILLCHPISIFITGVTLLSLVYYQNIFMININKPIDSLINPVIGEILISWIFLGLSFVILSLVVVVSSKYLKQKKHG